MMGGDRSWAEGGETTGPSAGATVAIRLSCVYASAGLLLGW